MVDNILKRRSEEENRRQEGHLPPGQSLTQKFPVLHYGPVPAFNPATWDFRIWEGVSLHTLVEQGFIKPNPETKYVIQHAEFGFTTNLPIEVMMAENFMLATHFNGEPISPDHGYPVRGVVGHIRDKGELFVPYFWKGAKWLRALEFRKDDKPGFWEQAGYHNQADVWKEQRFG